MSGRWEVTLDPETMGDDVEQQEQDGRTALDKTIDRIGMGSLCAFAFACRF